MADDCTQEDNFFFQYSRKLYGRIEKRKSFPWCLVQLVITYVTSQKEEIFEGSTGSIDTYLELILIYIILTNGNSSIKIYILIPM